MNNNQKLNIYDKESKKFKLVVILTILYITLSLYFKGYDYKYVLTLPIIFLGYFLFNIKIKNSSIPEMEFYTIRDIEK